MSCNNALASNRRKRWRRIRARRLAHMQTVVDTQEAVEQTVVDTQEAVEPIDDGIDWYALSNGLSGVFPDGTRFNDEMVM